MVLFTKKGLKYKKIANLFEIIKNFFLDLLFPQFCLGCQKEGVWLCPACERKILAVNTQVCPDCGRVSSLGKYCPRHLKPHRLRGIIMASYYQEGPIKELIHNFKYNHILELKEILVNLLVKALKNNLALAKKENILITAVPLHFLRQAQRGYNQSEILANLVADQLNLEKNFQIIKKIRWTKPQVKTSGEKRLKNLKNSFVFNKSAQIINKNIVRGKTIILVDDVTTTGTTLNECAWVLRQAGAQRVWGLVIAKG